jgi:hypothetical protein
LIVEKKKDGSQYMKRLFRYELFTSAGKIEVI